MVTTIDSWSTSMDEDDQSIAYRALSTVTAIMAGIATRSILQRVWTDATGEEPPNDPTDPGVGWREALSWAVSAGVAVGVGRVVGRRLAAGVYQKASGKQVVAKG